MAVVASKTRRKTYLVRHR